MKLAIWFSAALALAACGKGGGKGGDTGSGWPKKKLSTADVLGATKKPGLVGPFAAGKLGMTDEELKAAVPIYAKKGDFLSEREWGVSLFPYFRGGPADEAGKKTKKTFGSLNVRFDAKNPVDPAAIAAAWGPPIEVKEQDKPVSIWLDPDTKTRAKLESDYDDAKSLRIDRYVPAKEILGEPGKPLGIEGPRALLGSTAAELEAAYPENYDRTLDTLTFMNWAPDEIGDAFQMELGMKDGKVVSLQFWIHHGDNEKVKAERKALIEAKYGVAKEVKPEFGMAELVMAENPKVTLAETEGAWVIEVGRP
jgi:hypothetical protein